MTLRAYSIPERNLSTTSLLAAADWQWEGLKRGEPNTQQLRGKTAVGVRIAVQGVVIGAAVEGERGPML